MTERTTNDLFTRAESNPILRPTHEWWEANGVLNPGVELVDNCFALLYRAVGADGHSRFGLAWSEDGTSIRERGFFCEPQPGDWTARLGIEDPRLTWLDGNLWASYTKAGVDAVGSTPLSWEPAPFSMQSAIAKVDLAGRRLAEERAILPGIRAKDGVLFPRKVNGRYHMLVRIYPAMQVISSPDLATWSAPQLILEPRPDTWESERIGAGPPPVETPWGWLVIYHGNAHYIDQGNRRHYSTGIALLDLDDPSRVRYRHPDPILAPVEAYEQNGPVGMVVFATGLVARDGVYHLYYGAADGVICYATASVDTIHAFLQNAAGISVARPS